MVEFHLKTYIFFFRGAQSLKHKLQPYGKLKGLNGKNLYLENCCLCFGYIFQTVN